MKPLKVATEMVEGGGWVVRSMPADEPSLPRTKTRPTPPSQLAELLRKCQ